jgi:hypothetical protein
MRKVLLSLLLKCVKNDVKGSEFAENDTNDIVDVFSDSFNEYLLRINVHQN